MTVLGIDVSKWQGQMDWSKAARSGARFAFIRAGSADGRTGVNYPDFQFQRNAAEAPKANILTGAYWFFRPQFDVNRQAEYFCNLLVGKDLQLPPVLDVEIGGYSKTVMARRVRACLEAIKVITGKTPIVYTRATIWNPSIGLQSWAKDYPLWVARYTMLKHPWADDPAKLQPLGWTDWTFWQWSADENRRGQEFGSPAVNGSKAIDIDYFNGDEAALLKFANIQPTPAPVPEPPTAPGLGWKESIDAWARTKGYDGPKP